MRRRADRSRAQIAPRFIRGADAPIYLGMDEQELDNQVRPHVDALPIGSNEIAFDRMDFVEQRRCDGPEAVTRHFVGGIPQPPKRGIVVFSLMRRAALRTLGNTRPFGPVSG